MARIIQWEETAMVGSNRAFMIFCLGLGAWALSVAGAFAQAPAAAPQSDSRPGSPAAATLTGVWDTIEWIERRYKIEAMRFKARDETGVDWWGSDEVMVETHDIKGGTVTDEIGDIDSGDTHHFDPAKSCIIAVRPGIVVLGKTSVCDEVGEPAPLFFEVEFWEQDVDLPDTGFLNCAPGNDHHHGPHCARDNNDDDFIGHARVEFSAHDFEAVLPNVGDQYVETIVLIPCKETVCDVTYGPDYSFTYRITRLPDVRVDLRSVLNEAMQRSGARSEIEAIAAGLRSLRAPSPRKIEPERKM
jgi:hypothetical protein